jgi:hypothetical protein
MTKKKNIAVTYFDAIKSLQQYAEFGINGNDLNTLQWYDDESVVPRPTNEEIEVEYQRLLALVGDTEYKKERYWRYPPITDYLDGVVKGDQAQIDKYIAECLAIKAKFPKPE